MKIGLKFLICITAVAAWPGIHADTLKDYSVGEAFSFQGEQLLYRETHCEKNDGLQREVFYQDSRGQEIAYKSLDYRHGTSTPAFSQHNYQTNEKTQVSFEDDNIKMMFRDASGSTEEKSLDMTLQQTELPIVVDAGFDSYIRQHWDSLLGGEDHSFRFALPTRGQLVDLKVSATSCTYQSTADQCFLLEMDNWLFRMLVDNIELGYNPESRQLTRYRGLSNIEDASGNGIEVDIRYTYPDLSTQTCAVDRQSFATHGDQTENG